MITGMHWDIFTIGQLFIRRDLVMAVVVFLALEKEGRYCLRGQKWWNFSVLFNFLCLFLSTLHTVQESDNWYKVLSKKCIPKSTFRLKNENARFCIKGAHFSVHSRLLDNVHRCGDYLPRLWQSFQRCKCFQETLSTVPQEKRVWLPQWE